MTKQSSQQTTTVTAAEVREGIARGRVAAEEEKALRMRHGVGAPRTLVLERVGQDHPDAREKLLGIELELLRQWRERRQAAAPAVAPAAAAPAVAAPNARRDQIVKAIRAKKGR